MGINKYMSIFKCEKINSFIIYKDPRIQKKLNSGKHRFCTRF
jgi:hypothetical protein